MRGVPRHRGRAIPQPEGTEIQRRGQQTGNDADSLNCVATGGEPSKDAEYRVCGTGASKRGGLHPEPQAVSKRRLVLSQFHSSCRHPLNPFRGSKPQRTHAVSLYGLEFAKPRGNTRENMRLVAMRTSQLRTIARKICETLDVKLEPSINVAPCYGTNVLKHGHQCSYWTSFDSQNALRTTLCRRKIKQSGCQVFPRTVP